MTIIDPKTKVVGLQEAARRVEALRGEGKTVALANGCFDVLHVGHVRYLKGAAHAADFLVVGVNDDESYRALKKREPLTSDNARALIVAAIEEVDLVFLFSGLRVDEALLTLKPDFHAKGTDYTEESVPEKDIVKSFGGKVIITGDPKGHDSTRIMEKMGEAGHGV